MNKAKSICTAAGCLTICEGGRCSKHKRPAWAPHVARATAGERGYSSRWTEASLAYRRANPLCVPCRLQQRICSAQCVDHIIPRHSCEGLFWEQDNWCAMCNYCHARKTRREPRQAWQPDPSRIVVCGLPGTGKTTYAKASGLPYWDADELGTEADIEAIQTKRGLWMAAHHGPCVVIVASPITASTLACAMRGTIKHCISVYRYSSSRYPNIP